MKITYLAESIIPSRSANSIHVMKMCEAFSELGHEVTLVVPIYASEKYERNVEDIFEYYGITTTFKIKYISYPKIKGGIYIRAFKSAIFAYSNKSDIIYSRDFWGSLISTWIGLTISHEFHEPLRKYNGLKQYFVKQFYTSKRLKTMVVISDALKVMFTSEGIQAHRILVAHDAATEDHSEAISLTSEYNVGYVGHLFEGRGIGLIMGLATMLPKITFHLIGGREEDIKKNKASSPPKNVVFHGFLPPAKVGAYRQAMDILIAPYQNVVKIWGGIKNTADYMSPLKIFEYMSSKRPIIASDLPVIREVLNDNNAVLCDPKNQLSWSSAISDIQKHKINGEVLAAKAYDDFINNYTWFKRADKIINSI